MKDTSRNYQEGILSFSVIAHYTHYTVNPISITKSDQQGSQCFEYVSATAYRTEEPYPLWNFTFKLRNGDSLEFSLYKSYRAHTLVRMLQDFGVFSAGVDLDVDDLRGYRITNPKAGSIDPADEESGIRQFRAVKRPLNDSSDRQLLYVLRNKEFNRTKIGIGYRPKTRARAMERTSGIDTKVCGVYCTQQAAEDVETYLKKLFKPRRTHGEWFADLPPSEVEDVLLLVDSVKDFTGPMEPDRHYNHKNRGNHKNKKGSGKPPRVEGRSAGRPQDRNRNRKIRALLRQGKTNIQIELSTGASRSQISKLRKEIFGKTPKLNTEAYQRVVALTEQGESINGIVKLTGISRASVTRYRKALKEERCQRS